MSFLRQAGWISLLLFSASACKVREDSQTALKDATAAGPCALTVDSVEVPGVGYVGGMFANQNIGNLEMKKLDKTTWDVCTKLPDARVHKFNSSGSGLVVDVGGVTFQMPKNPTANWGYLNSNVKCGTVGMLLGLTFDSTQVDKICEVQFDTEDQSWYAATIRPEWLLAETGYDENADAANKGFLDFVMKKQVADGKGSSMDQPLAPRQINANVDNRVLGVMEILHKKYQANKGSALTEINRERNTCLRNGRAHSWLDLQAHFYCILPYQTRQCYSTALVNGTQGLSAITDPQVKLGTLLAAMNASYSQCFDPGKPYEFKKDFPNDGDTVSKAFKYVMFVRQGVMDFNVENSNELIEKFYASVKDLGTPKQPSRLLDPQPWRAKQKRYAEIRQNQAGSIRLGMAKNQCAAGGGTWNASNQCVCPANEAWNATTNKCEGNAVPEWQKYLTTDDYGTIEAPKPWATFNAAIELNSLMVDTAVYNNTRAVKFEDAKKLYSLPAKSIITEMQNAATKYDSNGTSSAERNSCLNLRSRTSYWSDLQIHYYCQHYNPRRCFSSTLSAHKDRQIAYGKCEDDSKFDIANTTDVNSFIGFRWISKEKSRANLFQYIMSANTYAFDMGQQQTIINAFYGVPTPGDFTFLATPEGRVKCQEARPTRKDEKVVRLPAGKTPLEFAQSAAGADYGGHCVPNKKWKVPLKGIGY